MEITKCRSCGAEISMLITVNGKRMPVNPTPAPNGTLAIEGDRCRVIKKGEVYDGDRYISHFATCPNATQHRKKPNADQHEAQEG